MFDELTSIIMGISIELWEFLMTLVMIALSIGGAAAILKAMTGSVLGGAGMAGTAILGLAGLIGLAMGVYVVVPAIAQMIQALRPAAPFSPAAPSTPEAEALFPDLAGLKAAATLLLFRLKGKCPEVCLHD